MSAEAPARDGVPGTYEGPGADTVAAPRSSTPFRPDVQGIRALAVLMVMANHMLPARLPGGYVGVDVFFVVSGYLITSLLLGEAERGGRISLAGFYARRARRIIPAATVVTVVTVVVSLLVLPLLRVQTIMTDAVWATLFAANIRMAEVGTDYFAQGEPPSPLRHYWSLSVEEQFYLVWPALLVVVLLLLRRRARRALAGPDGSDGSGDTTAAGRSVVRWAAAVLVPVVVASFVWSQWATEHSPVTAYYSSLARGWELGLGAACAVLARRRDLLARLPRWSTEALALAGLLAVVASMVVLSARTPFPGYAAALPVLGTVALVVAGLGGARTLVARLLSVRPAVLVGDWSYSLYLWHWPVIVLLRSTLGPARFTTPPVLAATVVGVLLLSWASYRFIETPFRRGRWKVTARALAVYPASVVAVVLTVVVSGQVVRYELGAFNDTPAISTAQYQGQRLGRDPYVALVRASTLAAKAHRAVPGDLVPGLLDLREQTASLGDCDYRTGTHRLCPVGDPSAGRTIVVLGDSHARALSPAVEKLAQQHHYKVYVLVYSGCAANDAVQIDRATGRPWPECQEFKQWADETVARLHPDLVVVSTSAGRVQDPDTGDVLNGGVGHHRYLQVMQAGWLSLFQRLDQDAGRVAIVGNTPKLPRETGVCLSQGQPDLGDCAFPPGPSAEAEAKASFRAAREAGVEVVDALDWFCYDDLCPSVVGHYITLRDSEHMTPQYARWLAPDLAARLGITGPVRPGSARQ